MEIKSKIINYLESNPKQCGLHKIKKEKLKDINQEIINKIKTIKLIENDNLFFDIIRECIYRKNIKFACNFSKSDWYSIFSENFIKTCSICNNEIKYVNWMCCDVFCSNCKIKYEVKSKLKKFKKENEKIYLGTLIGVYDFIKNEKNCIIIHYLDGYYYFNIKDIKNKYVLEIHDNKEIYNFTNIDDIINFVEINDYTDFIKSKHLKIILKVSSVNFKRYVEKDKKKKDKEAIVKQIKEINKAYNCLHPKENIDNLIDNFVI